MAEDAFDVDVDPYDGIDIEQIASEELEKLAIQGMNQWRENLRQGEGDEGGHGRPYVNTGEAVNDITVRQEGDFTYLVGGDVIQLIIAETGASWDGTMPPYSAIRDWAKEVGLVSDPPEWSDDRSFLDMLDLPEAEREEFLIIWGVMQSLADEGLDAFKPGRLAAKQTREGADETAGKHLDEALEDAAGG